jgi:outer membrane lipoprotein-sorting protein
MKRAAFFCALFLLCGVLRGVFLYAQIPADAEAVFAFPLGEAGRFSELCADLSGHPFIRGTFVQTKTISRLNRSLVSEGNFIIARDMGMVWETLKPFPSTMTAGRDYLLQSTPSGTKTRLDARGNETFLRFSDTISAVFSGDAQKLLDNFTVYFTEAGGVWTMGLVPSEKAIRTFAARIIMSGEASLIRTVTLHEQNGGSIRYALSGHSCPASLSAGERALFDLE